jgi:hypothetical protein
LILQDAWIHAQSPEGLAYDADESPELAVSRALDFWGDPPFSAASRATLEQWSASCVAGAFDEQEAARVRAMRQNALRQLVGASPDLQVC